MKRGKLVVISGPSGVGKGTICKKIVARCPDVALSVSVTTRAKRGREVDGRHYFFRTDEQFDELIANDGLLEWAEYNGRRYGTPRREVEEAVSAGKTVILEIEVEGGMQVKEKFADTLMVFIAPPSISELRRRLTARGTETPEQIHRRLKRAEYEMLQREYYDKVVINGSLNRAVDEVIKAISTS